MMSALLFAAAAGSFVPPSFTQENVDRLQQGFSGDHSEAVLIEVKVDPKGRIIDCKASSAVGSADFAASVCSDVERLRVKQALIAGQSAYGVISTLIRFQVYPDRSRQKVDAAQQAADMELQVNKLPAGKSTVRVEANILIDAAGKPQACYADKDPPQAYADVACTQVSGITFGALKDDGGKPVSYVRTVIIDFDLASASPATGG
jgi:hypothetical protein